MQRESTGRHCGPGTVLQAASAQPLLGGSCFIKCHPPSVQALPMKKGDYLNVLQKHGWKSKVLGRSGNRDVPQKSSWDA